MKRTYVLRVGQIYSIEQYPGYMLSPMQFEGVKVDAHGRWYREFGMLGDGYGIIFCLYSEHPVKLFEM